MSVEFSPIDGCTALRIDGTAVAKEIKTGLKAEIDAFTAEFSRSPGLTVVLVGDRRDSATYVRMKEKACAAIGIKSAVLRFPADVEQAELLDTVDKLNADAGVDGILVQLPLPAHIEEHVVLDRVDSGKDVDGLHPLNAASLLLHGPKPGSMAPCTPSGCIELIERALTQLGRGSLQGKRAVVIGRSNMVGKPAALLLLAKSATVTICHSRTLDLADRVGEADIVVAAVGRANFIQGAWLKPGAIVVDVGINSVDDASAKRGYRLVGDVDFDSAKSVAGAITPVPGGVGPMTIAMLLKNTVASAFQRERGAAGTTSA